MEKFKNILIVYKENLSNKDSVDEVKRLLKGTNFSAVKINELKEELFDVDLVITIGGDGTFIKAASFVKDGIMLGINPDSRCSEGALTSISENELHLLKDIFNGNYKTIQRQRLDVKLNGNVLKEQALNEVYAGTSLQFQSSRYVLKFKGKEEEQRSSGILVATGTGSNAWYKSASGKPFGFYEKKFMFLVREPYFGRLFKPELLRGEILEGEKIIIESKRGYGGIIAVDSNTAYDFNTGDSLELKLSDFPLEVIIK